MLYQHIINEIKHSIKKNMAEKDFIVPFLFWKMLQVVLMLSSLLHYLYKLK